MSAITPEAHLISDLGSNDLLKAELLMELEDAYEIECPDDVAEAIRTTHRRDRLWIVAYPDSQGQPTLAVDDEASRLPTSGAVADAYRLAPVGSAIARQELHPWADESGLARVVHGVPHQVDRRTALGNAVVPQIPELIGRAILSALLSSEAA